MAQTHSFEVDAIAIDAKHDNAKENNKLLLLLIYCVLFNLTFYLWHENTLVLSHCWYCKKFVTRWSTAPCLNQNANPCSHVGQETHITNFSFLPCETSLWPVICNLACDTLYLPPANKVWAKVMFLHLFVILFTRERGLASQHASQVARTRKWAVHILV